MEYRAALVCFGRNDGPMRAPARLPESMRRFGCAFAWDWPIQWSYVEIIFTRLWVLMRYLSPWVQ